MTKSKLKNWTIDKLPSLDGKNVFITGANAGIGFEAANQLALKGANVLIGCRNEQRAIEAVEKLKKCASGRIDYVLIDLSNMESVKAAARVIREKYDHIDININNAGVMQTPQIKTEDGFDLQFATNHLGHFLLNGLIFDLVDKVDGRIAVVCSLVHKFGKIHFNNLTLENDYAPMKAYAQSKLANLMYAFELDRKVRESGVR